MEITYKEDYKITCNKYSWDLHVRRIRQKDTSSGKKGSYYWSDEGFFTSLDTLVNKVMRMEAEKNNSTVTLSDYLVLYYDIMKNFREHVTEIKKEE